MGMAGKNFGVFFSSTDMTDVGVFLAYREGPREKGT